MAENSNVTTDGPVINVPTRLLALAKVCGHSPGRIDTRQVRVGWDDEGPWASASDGKVLVFARWHPDVRDPRHAPGIEFGVGADQIKHAARIVRKRPIRWAPMVAMSPGAIGIQQVGVANSATFRGPTTGTWVPGHALDMIEVARTATGSGVSPAEICPFVLASFNRFLAAYCESDEFDAVMRLVPIALPVSGWAAEIGNSKNGHMAYAPRCWAVVAGLNGEMMSKWSPAVEPTPAEATA